MQSSFENIPRLGETKIKPKIGEIRLAINGKRRKVFDGRCWQYLCNGDPTCRVQAKFICRHHRHLLKDTDESLDAPTPTLSQSLKPGEAQTLPNGNRRLWRGARWHSLCRADDCLVQAKDFCKAHQPQRVSLPNTNQNVTPQTSRVANRTRSCTVHDEIEQDPELQNQPTPTVPDEPPLQLPSNKRRRFVEKQPKETAASSPKKHEVQTRHGRRVRCNGLMWKHLCADKKSILDQRESILENKTDKSDQNNTDSTASLPSDIIATLVQTSPITEIKNSKKRKTTGDRIHREQVVAKRRSVRQRQKGSNKSNSTPPEPGLSLASVSEIPAKEKSVEELAIVEPEISLSLKSSRLNSNHPSIEIPVQCSSPLPYDSSASAILEQFGTIIKKEAIIEEESLICIPSTYPNESPSPCETLQDFLRVEEMKKKEFKLDCQRISYRLAKIQDCIGSLSTLTS